MFENAEKVIEKAGEHFEIKTGVERPVKVHEGGLPPFSQRHDPDAVRRFEEKMAEKPIAMPDSPFEGFRMGANCDMRVRLAIEILTHSPMFAPGKDVAATPEEAALFALDTATYLLDTAFERGLIKPFGEVSKDPHLLAHMHRQIEWQIVSTKATQKAQEEASR